MLLCVAIIHTVVQKYMTEITIMTDDVRREDTPVFQLCAQANCIIMPHAKNFGRNQLTQRRKGE